MSPVRGDEPAIDASDRTMRVLVMGGTQFNGLALVHELARCGHDVTIVNRQLLHGSFVNSSPDPRLSITFGFHRRSSVLGVEGKLQYKADVPGQADLYDEERIFIRSAVIATAIDARSQHYPGESRFRYAPFVGLEHDYRYNDDTYERVLRDYNTRDIFI